MNETPTFVERFLSAATYLTAGMAGFFWIVVCAVRRTYPSRFGLYHIMQSIFLSLFYFIVDLIFWKVIIIFDYIPIINKLVRQLIFFFNSPFLFGYSIMQCLIYGTVIYLAVFAFMGLYSYIPVASDIIKSNFKR